MPTQPDDFGCSALIGIPLRNVSLGNTTFSVESNYMELVCDRVNQTEGWKSIEALEKERGGRGTSLYGHVDKEAIETIDHVSGTASHVHLPT